MSKRFISLILSAIMILACVPVTEAEEIITVSAFSEIKCSAAAQVQGINSTNGILGSTTGYGWARFDNVDFGQSGVEEFTVKVGVDSSNAGKKLEFYLDNLDSAPFATLTVKNTGGWTTREWQKTQLEDPDIYGVHSVFIVYYSSGTGDCEAFQAKPITDSTMLLPATIEGTGYEEKFSVLNALDIIEWNVEENFDTSAPFTAGQFARWALMLKGTRYDEDIKQLLSSCGLKDADAITAKKGCEMIMKLLGRDVLIGDNIDWYSVAADIDVRVSVSPDENLDWFSAMDLIYDTLDAEPAVLERVEGAEGGKKAIFTVRKDNTLLMEYRKIYKSSGILTMDSITGLDGVSDIGEGRVLIGKYIFDVGDCDVTDLIGCDVEYYFKSTDYANTLLYIAPSVKNQITTVVSKDIVDYSNRTLTYYNGEKNKTIKIPNDAKIIYNGLVVSKYTEDMFKMDSGSIELICNNRDSVPEVVKIWDTKDYLFTACVDDVIYLKDANNKTIPLDAPGYITVLHGKGSRAVVPEKLAENTVITVAEVQAIDKSYTLYNVYTSKKTVEGTIRGKDIENRVLNISGTDYAMSGYFAENNAASLSIGNDIKAYLNTFDEIAFTDTASISNMLGYLVKYWVDEDTDDVMVKIFDENGDMKTYRCADNLYINRNKSTDIETDLSGTEKLMLFSANNSGVLKKINFAEAEATGNAQNGLYHYFDVSDELYKDGSMALGGKTVLSSDFTYFEIPLDTTAYERYRVSNKTFRDDAKVTMKCYNRHQDKLDITVGVSTYDPVDQDINPNADVFYIADIKEEYDDTNEVRITVSYYDGANQKLVKKKMNIECHAAASGLKIGDGVKISLDEAGEIAGVEKVLSPENSWIYSGDTHFGAQNRYEKGNVVKKQDNLIQLAANGEVYNLKNTAVYIVENDEVRLGTSRDVLSAETMQTGSEVYMFIWYGKVKSLIIKR